MEGVLEYSLRPQLMGMQGLCSKTQASHVSPTREHYYS